MSDDLVNQLTLNLLINKSHLQKINRKLNNTENDVNKQTELETYRPRIEKLFRNMLVNERPTDLLQDVNSSFDLFIGKCIYYFKVRDETKLLEKERNNHVKEDISDNIKEDINFELEFDEEEEEEEEGEGEGDEDINCDYNENCGIAKDEYDLKSSAEVKNKTEMSPWIVNRKYSKKNNSTGVDDIQKLPLNWFEKVRHDYKKNNIIPRRKDDK